MDLNNNKSTEIRSFLLVSRQLLTDVAREAKVFSTVDVKRLRKFETSSRVEHTVR